MTHQLGEFERRNGLPVAQHILANPVLENPGGLPGGGDVYVKKDKKVGQVSESSLRADTFQAEETACGNSWRQKETWSFG